MSLSTEIQRLHDAKDAIRLSIVRKGVQVPSAAKLDDYSDYVDLITLSGFVMPLYVESMSLDDYGKATGTLAFNESLTEIHAGAFQSCSSLTSVSMPAVTAIDNSAFSNCSSLTSVSMPAVTSIGQGAFYGCSSLTSVSMPAVTTIDDFAFRYCSSLTSVSMTAVTTIGHSAFEGCILLTSVSMPAVTTIDQQAFSGCTSLTSVDIGEDVISIGQNAFRDCTSITSFTCRATTPPTTYSDVFTNTSNNLIIYVPAESVDTYKIRQGWSSYKTKIQAIPS